MELFGHLIHPDATTSRRDQVRELLRREIMNGRWSPGDQLPTVRELALDSGLSTSPITHALNDLVEEGYLMRHVGRGTFLRSANPSRKSLLRTVGVVFGGARPGWKTNASEALERDLLAAVGMNLTREGFTTRTFHEDDLTIEDLRPEQIVATSPLRQMDGLLNIGPIAEHVQIQAQALNIPVVCLGDPHPPAGIAFVAGGIQQAVCDGLDILYGMGHRKVGLAHAFGGLHNRTRHLRYEAYFAAASELGLANDEEWIVDAGPRHSMDITKLRGFLTNSNRPTAVVCTHNHVAQALVDVAELFGVRIPQEFSLLLITGHADFGDTFRPPLSTLVIPTDVYAQKAVDLLIDMIARETTAGDAGVIIRPYPVMRKSIATLAATAAPGVALVK